MSEQVKLDREVKAMVNALVTVFGFCQDANDLADKVELLASFEKSILKLLDLIIDCSLFVREYIRRSFIGTISVMSLPCTNLIAL